MHFVTKSGKQVYLLSNDLLVNYGQQSQEVELQDDILREKFGGKYLWLNILMALSEVVFSNLLLDTNFNSTEF